MNERVFNRTISTLPLGGAHFYPRTGSTNDLALAWAEQGAPDRALVYAEEQVSGRGRGDRRWFTPRGAGLAFSLVLRPLPGEALSVSLFSGLGALAVCEALGKRGLAPQIKWPNDVLLDQRKVCGILAESIWNGDQVDSLILGIGVNVRPASIPALQQLNYPATCLEAMLGKRVNRPQLLGDILRAVLAWRGRLTEPDFLVAWENQLAFRGERVEIRAGGLAPITGDLEGLAADGSLRLRAADGQPFTVPFGEIHLRRDV